MRFESEEQLFAHGIAADLPIGILEEEANFARDLARTQFGGGRFIEQHRAFAWFEQAIHQAHGSGFSCAIRTDEGDEFAIIDREAHVAQDGQLVIVGSVNITELDHASTSLHTLHAPSTSRTEGPR